jgi:hypothetical protein
MAPKRRQDKRSSGKTPPPAGLAALMTAPAAPAAQMARLHARLSQNAARQAHVRQKMRSQAKAVRDGRPGPGSHPV